jgi:hypothetical protein
MAHRCIAQRLLLALGQLSLGLLQFFAQLLLGLSQLLEYPNELCSKKRLIKEAAKKGDLPGSKIEKSWEIHGNTINAIGILIIAIIVNIIIIVIVIISYYFCY